MKDLILDMLELGAKACQYFSAFFPPTIRQQKSDSIMFCADYDNSWTRAHFFHMSITSAAADATISKHGSHSTPKLN